MKSNNIKQSVEISIQLSHYSKYDLNSLILANTITCNAFKLLFGPYFHVKCTFPRK